MPRFARPSVFLYFLLLSFPFISVAQQTAPVIQRDSSSLSILSRALSTAGANALALLSSGIVAKGNLKVPPAGISGPILWENQGAEFRHERPGPNGTIVFLSGHGNPALIDGTWVQKNIGHVVMTTLPPHLPFVALATALSNTNVQIAAPQQVALGSSSVILVSFVDKTDDVTSVICKQDWYFNSQTFLPVRVDFLSSEIHNALNTVKMSYVFSNYQLVSGMLIPFTVDTLIDGQQISEIAFTSVQIGTSISSSDFAVPAATTGGAQ